MNEKELLTLILNRDIKGIEELIESVYAKIGELRDTIRSRMIIINALKEANFTEKVQELSKENTEEAIEMNELEELRIRAYNSLMVFKR